MGKSNQTNKKNNIKTIVVNQLAKEYKVTTRFVNMALSDNRDSELAKKIKEEYKKRYAAIEVALN